MDGSLVERAARALDEGPVHTLDLARLVLGLQSDAGPASAAIFTLLGTDERFHVDGEGFWRLTRPTDRLGPGLREEVFAVVDVETTGSTYQRGHRITEVAIVEIRGGVVDRSYRTLINPGRRIPSRVSALTGITDEMVAPAPYFDHVADAILEHLRGRVFVAHNARFDWGFLSAQLGEAMGEVPEVRRLCTVRMARKLVPELRRRNLDAVTNHYGVEIEDRHRAYGDALATARVFLRMLDEAERKGIGTVRGLEGFLAGTFPTRGASAG